MVISHKVLVDPNNINARTLTLGIKMTQFIYTVMNISSTMYAYVLIPFPYGRSHYNGLGKWLCEV